MPCAPAVLPELTRFVFFELLSERYGEAAGLLVEPIEYLSVW